MAGPVHLEGRYKGRGRGHGSGSLEHVAESALLTVQDNGNERFL